MKDSKEGFGSRFINVIKKKWLINGTLTAALVLLLVGIFVLITIGMQKLELTPIDLTKEKTYTVTDESKERISKIDKDVNIYLIAYTDEAPAVVIAKQYNKANSHINVEAIDINKRSDIAQKYGISNNETNMVIVECGERSKVLAADDLTSFDMNTLKSSDVTEEKLTSSILTVTTDYIPKVYFLQGYSEFDLDSNMTYLSVFLQNEIMEVEKIDIVSKGAVPEDCDTLVITSPTKDFESSVADAIIKYINKGGNILWFNSSYAVETKLPNAERVLAAYGVNPFSIGYIQETDEDKYVVGAPYMIRPEVESTDITDNIASGRGLLMAQATKLNIQEDKLSELKVEKEDLLHTSETSYFRSDLAIQSQAKTEKDVQGEFTIGAKLTKTIKDDTKSTLIIYGDNYFVSDMAIPISQESQEILIRLYNNKDLAINSILSLTEREQDITIRKGTNDVTTYTATQKEATIITTIIFAVPAAIIAVGIAVWQIRRRKK